MSSAGHTPTSPRRTVASGWSTDPDVQGAYTYLRPGGSAAHRHRLADAVLPGLWLAGEATSVDHPATMHGAWFSGERAARQVLATAAPRTVDPVLVVGAGLSGISAARMLTAHGRPTIVCEATAHLGGRARTDTSLGVHLHLGGAWLHGDQGHPLVDYVTTKPDDWENEAAFMVGVGRLSDADVVAAMEARRSVDEAIAAAPSGSTAASVLEVALAALPVSEPARALVRAWLEAEVESLYAAPLDDFAVPEGFEDYALPGGDQLITSSLGDTVQRLAEALDVRLSHRIGALRLADERWHTDTGIVASNVIVTIAAMALRAGRVEITPPLPPEVRDALDHLGAGSVVKVFAAYDERWWPEVRVLRLVGDGPLRLAADMSDVTGVPTLCWFATGHWARRIETMNEAERAALLDRVVHDYVLAPGVG